MPSSRPQYNEGETAGLNMMKLDKSPQRIVLGLIGTALSLASTTALATGLLEAKAVNAQTRLQSVPEIGWSTRLNSFELDNQNEGQVFTFRCPTAPQGQVYAPVWGTDIYTVNSGLCWAAVHAGMITFDGGLINVEMTTGQFDFQGSTRFGVASKSDNREFPSFRFIGNPIVREFDRETKDKEEKNQSRRRPNAMERAVGNGVRRGIERAIEDSIRDIFR